ncbi:MAG: social motility TPR repeat lipoprotein Tgl [Archangium sp.]|nr:social motility TPR repeat lipoprotein Tgl [Archangium sp.]
MALGQPNTLASAGAKPPTGKSSALLNLGKLFASFALAAVVGCAHVSERDRVEAQAHYDLALNVFVERPRESYKEIESALKANPEHAESWHLKALLLHTAFGRTDEALTAYGKALQLKPVFSEARVNYGNLLMDQHRYDEAIAQYELALNDVLYGGTFIAHGNMGWALYKKGDVRKGLEHLRAAVSLNSKYCLGHLQLGMFYEEQGSLADSCKAYGKYREACPEAADAYRREGVCQAKSGDAAAAAKSFDTCLAKATIDDLKDQCTTLKAQLRP